MEGREEEKMIGIIAGFIAGEIMGLMTAAVISGMWDAYREWRQRKHEQKSIRNHFSHRGGGDHA